MAKRLATLTMQNRLGMLLVESVSSCMLVCSFRWQGAMLDAYSRIQSSLCCNSMRGKPPAPAPQLGEVFSCNCRLFGLQEAALKEHAARVEAAEHFSRQLARKHETVVSERIEAVSFHPAVDHCCSYQGR